MGRRCIKILLTVSLILAVFLTACSNTAKKAADDAVESSGKLTISGVDGKDIELTVDELKSFEQVTKDVTAIDSAGKKTDYKVKGPLFEEVLKKYGKTQKDLKAITFVAGDNYSVEVPEEVLKNRDIVLALEVNGEPLDDRTKPVRAVVPDERAMYWVRNLVKIELTGSVTKVEANRIVFIDSVQNNLPSEDYKYYESTDRVFKTGEILSKFGTSQDSDTITLKAADKLTKNEKKENFLKGYIKFTGDASPAFVSTELPVGMHVKNILWFSYGPDVFFSVSKGLGYFKNTALDDKNGIALKELIDESGLKGGETYTMEGLDGYSAEVKSEDLDKGLVYLNDKGDVSIYFKDLPKNMNIKGLLSISCRTNYLN